MQKRCHGFEEGQEIIVEEYGSGCLWIWNTFVRYVIEILEVDRHVAETVRAGIQPHTIMSGTCHWTTRMEESLQQIACQSKCPTKKKTGREGTSLTNLQCYIAEGDDFLWHVTDGDTWMQHHNPEEKDGIQGIEASYVTCNKEI